MKLSKLTLVKITPIFFLLLLFSFTEPTIRNVQGWDLIGSDPMTYKMGTRYDKERGSKVGFLRSSGAKKENDHYGTMLQSSTSSNIDSDMVRLTGFLRSNDVQNWSGMWVRLEDTQGKILAFKDMMDAPIRGTTDWNKYELLLKVPDNAVKITFGVLINGIGSVSMDDFKLEQIKNNIVIDRSELKVDHLNLDFEKSKH